MSLFVHTQLPPKGSCERALIGPTVIAVDSRYRLLTPLPQPQLKPPQHPMVIPFKAQSSPAEPRKWWEASALSGRDSFQGWERGDSRQNAPVPGRRAPNSKCTVNVNLVSFGEIANYSTAKIGQGAINPLSRLVQSSAKKPNRVANSPVSHRLETSLIQRLDRYHTHSFGISHSGQGSSNPQ